MGTALGVFHGSGLDFILGLAMRRYLGNFLRTGDPNGSADNSK